MPIRETAIGILDARYLKLDQTTPQTVINGQPIFGQGFKITAGYDIRPTADSLSAISIANAAGTKFLYFDTTYQTMAIGKVPDTANVQLDILSSGIATFRVKTSSSSSYSSILNQNDNGSYYYQIQRGTAATGTLFGISNANATQYYNVSAGGAMPMLIGTYGNNQLVFGTNNILRVNIAGNGDITFGSGVAGYDQVLTFDGETNDGVLTWMEDEDYFKFSDDILMNSTERIYFRDTDIYINSTDDSYMDFFSNTGNRFRSSIQWYPDATHGAGMGYRSGTWCEGSSGNPAMMLRNGAGNWCFFDMSGTDVELGNGTAGGSFHFVTDDLIRMTILTGGNVGIGNSSPSYKLDVNGDMGITGTAIFTASGGSTIKMRLVNDSGGRYAFWQHNLGPGDAIDNASYDAFRFYFDAEPTAPTRGFGIQVSKAGDPWSSFKQALSIKPDTGAVLIGTYTDDGTGAILQAVGSNSTYAFNFTNNGNDRIVLFSSPSGVGATFGIQATDTGGHLWRFQSFANGSGQGGGKFGFYDETTNNSPFYLDGNNNVVLINTYTYHATLTDSTKLEIYSSTANRNRVALVNPYVGNNSSVINWYGEDGGAYATIEPKWELGNDYSQNGTQTFYIYDSKNSALRFHIDSSGGIQFNNAFRFPTADGTDGQVLTTDGAGNIAWEDAGAGASYWTRSGGTLYPATITDKVLVGSSSDDLSGAILQVTGDSGSSKCITINSANSTTDIALHVGQVPNLLTGRAAYYGIEATGTNYAYFGVRDGIGFFQAYNYFRIENFNGTGLGNLSVGEVRVGTETNPTSTFSLYVEQNGKQGGIMLLDKADTSNGAFIINAGAGGAGGSGGSNAYLQGINSGETAYQDIAFQVNGASALFGTNTNDSSGFTVQITNGLSISYSRGSPSNYGFILTDTSGVQADFSLAVTGSNYRMYSSCSTNPGPDSRPLCYLQNRDEADDQYGGFVFLGSVMQFMTSASNYASAVVGLRIYPDGALDMLQISTPGTYPESGRNKLYFKSDDKLYKMDSSGNETEVGGGGGSGYWTQSSGLLYPSTITDKVLIGSSADDGSGALLQVPAATGLSIGGFPVTAPTPFTPPSRNPYCKTNVFFDCNTVASGTVGGVYLMGPTTGFSAASLGIFIDANASGSIDPMILLRDTGGKVAGLGHNGSTYFFSEYTMFSVTNSNGTDTIDFACQDIYAMYSGVPYPSIKIPECQLIDRDDGKTILDWSKAPFLNQVLLYGQFDMTGIQGDDNRNRLSLGALGNTGNASRSSAILWYGYNNPDPYPGDTLEAKWEMGNDYYLNATQTFYLYDSVNSTLKYLLNSYGIGFPQKTFCGMLPSSDYDSVLNILTTSGSAFKVYHESSSSSFFNFAVISGGGAQGYSTSHYGLMEAYTGGGRMSFEFFPEEMIIKTGNGTKTLWMYSDHTAKFFNSLTIGSGAAGVDYTLTFDGETNDGILTWMEDEDYFKFNDDIFIGTEKLYFNGTDTSFYESGDDVHLDTPSNKTLVLDEVVYDDIRVVPGSFDRPGASDPTMVAVTPGGGTTTYLWEFKKNDIASFTVQLPHSYKTGQDIKVHIHWTPGDRGNEENGNTVGWKIDYTWANINGAFGTMSTADCSDACNGTDWEHDMTPDIVIDGHTAAKGISSMLICNIKRTDTGTDDTWVSTTSGQLPLLLEIDFHFPIDTIGSRDWGAK